MPEPPASEAARRARGIPGEVAETVQRSTRLNENRVTRARPIGRTGPPGHPRGRSAPRSPAPDHRIVEPMRRGEGGGIRGRRLRQAAAQATGHEVVPRCRRLEGGAPPGPRRSPASSSMPSRPRIPVGKHPADDAMIRIEGFAIARPAAAISHFGRAPILIGSPRVSPCYPIVDRFAEEGRLARPLEEGASQRLRPLAFVLRELPSRTSWSR